MRKENFIGSTDVPTLEVEQDLFNIKTYIDGLSTFINQCATPMTISIQGDWGSGKTSIMEMIKGKISESVHTVWFNTWQFSQFNNSDGLVFSMMEVLLEKLGCEEKMIAKIFRGLFMAGKAAVKVAAGAIAGEVGANEMGEMIDPEHTINYAKEVLGLKDKFREAVNNIVSKSNKNRVVVFVDDLDRLRPEKAVELLEVLKLFLECENCVFVIAVDYDVVTRGIKQKYGDDVSEEKGKSFFDKIIQLPFKVPVAQYDIENYVSTSLGNMDIKVSGSDVKLFTDLIKTSIGLNPRSMKRLFNTYLLLDIITRISVKALCDENRHRILFSVICMQMGHEDLYQYFASSVIDVEFLEKLGNSETVEDAIKEIVGFDNDILNNYKKMDKMKRFVGCLYRAIQNDNDDKISEEELANFKSVVKCSSVLSVGEDDSFDDSSDWDDRYKNKKLSEQVNEILADLGEMKTWQPRKARENVKISDISSYLYFSTPNGFDFTLEYYLSRSAKKYVNVHVVLYNKTAKKEEVFFNTFGENPLNFDKNPECESWGRIMYTDVIRVTDDGAREIADLYLKAYREITKYIK